MTASDPSDKTRIGPAHPPQPKLPGSPPPPAAAPAPAAPPPEGASDRTSPGSHPPPAFKAPPPPPPTSAPAPPAGEDEEEEGTVILNAVRRPSASLQRVKPAGRSDVIPLQRARYSLGRAQQCDIPLFSPTSSREHATLVNREGAWFLVPAAGKSVIVDGSPLKEEIRLAHKMRVQLGDDELVFFDESAAAAPAQPAEETPGARPSAHRTLIVIGAVVAAVLVVALALWLRS